MKHIIHYTAGGVTRYLCDKVWGGLWLEDMDLAIRFDTEREAKEELHRQFKNRPNAVMSRVVPVTKMGKPILNEGIEPGVLRTLYKPILNEGIE